MRKNFLKRNLCCLISSLCLTAHTAVAGDLDISYGKWQITFDESSKTVTYVYQDLTLLKKVFVQAVNANGEELKSIPTLPSKRKVYPMFSVTEKNILISIPVFLEKNH